jgi:hypothetical protein
MSIFILHKNSIKEGLDKIHNFLKKEEYQISASTSHNSIIEGGNQFANKHFTLSESPIQMNNLINNIDDLKPIHHQEINILQNTNDDFFSMDSFR